MNSNIKVVVAGLISLIILTACSSGSGGSSATPIAAQTDSGTVQGVTDGNLNLYKGIPYAKPPVGTLRWKAPQRPDPWTGERSATSFGPHCAQTGLTTPGLSGSEDCLTLNVWAPTQSATALLPVFVYLHEGANLVGSGDIDFSRFAQAGPVVVVSLNYRLGPFGFLGHPGLATEDPHGSTGNYGILDQIAALQWVQRNIRNFDGDPARVTVGGYSAGAHDTAVLVTSPLAQGLFSAAVVMSHTWMVQPAAVVTNTAQVAVTFLGCDAAPDVVACLRGKNAAEIVAVPGNGTSNLAADPRCNSESCRFNLASVDGYVLPKTPRQIVRDGTHNKVPMLIGSTTHEWTTTYYILNTEQGFVIATDVDYQYVLSKTFPAAAANMVHTLYPPSSYTADYYSAPASAYIIAMGDIFNHCPVRSMLNEIGTHQTQPLWQYVWAHGPNPPLYAGHMTDFPYIFLTYAPGSLSSPEQTLSSNMSGAWLRFIANHDPRSGTLDWPAYQPVTYNFRVWETPEVLGSNPVVQATWRHSQCGLLEQNGFDWEVFP